MTAEEILELDIEYSTELADLRNRGDTENMHKLADDILCHALRRLGCDQIVDKFRELPKWYS